jgi:hypothetical protein
VRILRAVKHNDLAVMHHHSGIEDTRRLPAIAFGGEDVRLGSARPSAKGQSETGGQEQGAQSHADQQRSKIDPAADILKNVHALQIVVSPSDFMTRESSPCTGSGQGISL